MNPVWDKDMYFTGRAYAGNHPLNTPAGHHQFPLWSSPMVTRDRQTLLSPLQGLHCATGSSDWSPLWLVAGVLLAYAFLRPQEK